MKFNSLETSVTALMLLASLSATAQIANSQPQVNPNLRVNPELFKLNIGTQISGAIANSGSNNGGQPNFACNEIEVYVAQSVPVPPPVGGGISLPKYEKIGNSVKATGDIAKSCEYTLPITTVATGKQIYVFATSPSKWTTAVNVVDISPAGWVNPVQIAKNQQLKNMNMKISATLIK